MILDALAAWARVCAGHPWPIGIVVVLISLGAVFGLTKFEIDPDVSALLPENDPDVALFMAANLDEESSRSLFLLVRGEDLEERLPEFVRRLEESPFLQRVIADRTTLGGALVDQAPRAPLWYLPEASLDQLEQRLSPSGLRLAAAETKTLISSDPLMGAEVAKSDPLGLRWILSQASEETLPDSFERESRYLLVDEGRAAFLKLEGEQPAFDVDFSEELLADLESRSVGFDVVAAGGYSIAREDSRRIRSDLSSSFNGSIPLLFLFFLLSTRSFWVPHLYLLPTGLAVLWTLGYGGLLLGPVTPLAVCSAAILCGLGVDFSIHYIGRFREERATADFATALQAAHRATGRSLLGCWMTSCVAFLSFSLGSFPGLRDLGWLLALGLSFALLSTWTVLPLLLRRVGPTSGPKHRSLVVEAFQRLAPSPLATPGSWLVILAALSGWGLVATRGVTFDADPQLLRPEQSEVAASLDELEAALGFSPEGVTLLLEANESPQLLIDAANDLRERGVVAFANVSTLTPHSVQRRARVATFRRSTANWISEATSALNAEGFRADRMRGALDEFAERLESDPEASPTTGTRLDWKGQQYWRASFHPPAALHNGAERQEFRDALQSAVAAPTRSMDPAALGDSIGPLLAAELGGSLGACALLVALVIMASVGRVRQGWIAMTPALCGLGVVLGVLSIMDWPIHPGNLLALPLLLGLGVDDGLYMVNRHLEGKGDPLRSIGQDVWRTTVTTAIGFGSLVTAQSPAIASLGAIVLIGTATCFVATVVLVPWILRLRAHA